MEVWGWRGTLNSPRNTKGEEREKMSHRGGGRRPDADPSFSVASSHCASESNSTCYVMTDYWTHCRHHDENWKSDLFQSVWFPFFWRGEEALIYFCVNFFFRRSSLLFLRTISSSCSVFPAHVERLYYRQTDILITRRLFSDLYRLQ